MEAKIQFNYDRFENNVKNLQKLTAEEVTKTVKAGAASYAVVAAKYTPPDMKSARISPQYYQDGILWDGKTKIPPGGRRLIIDLLRCAKSSSRWSSWAGSLLRKGYYYYVTSGKRKAVTSRKFGVACKTYSEAVSYARLTYRGLLRAAWGMTFLTIGMKIPNAFSYLIANRPRILNRSDLASASMTADSITLNNNVREANRSFAANMDAKASYQAMKTMNQRMEKFFSKSTDL